MRLGVEVFFKIDFRDNKFLLTENVLDWTKAIITDQGLDRMGDSYWIDGIHVGSGQQTATEASTGIGNSFIYKHTPFTDRDLYELSDEHVEWSRELSYLITNEELGDRQIREMALSWGWDTKTAVALNSYGVGVKPLDGQDVIVSCKVVVTQRMDDVLEGIVDLGANPHNFTIKPCHVSGVVNPYIGYPLKQANAKVHSGAIPKDVELEPSGEIDVNVATFDEYLFGTRSKTFKNFFTLSSPNADTKTITSKTMGLPSAYAVEFNPPIDKSFNRELTLNFKINWNRG